MPCARCPNIDNTRFAPLLSSLSWHDFFARSQNFIIIRAFVLDMHAAPPY